MQIIDTSGIRTKIGNIKRSESSRRENVHDTCVAICGHALKYGSSPLGTLLLAALTTQGDKKLVGDWLKMHGPFVINGADVQFSKKARAERFDAVRTDEEIERHMDCISNDAPPWYEAKLGKRETNTDALSIEDTLTKLIKRAKKLHADEDEAGAAVKDFGLVTYLESALARYHSDAALALARAPVATPQALELHRAEEATRAEQHTVPEADEIGV